MAFASTRIFYKPGRNNMKFGDRRKMDKYGKQPNEDHIYTDGAFEDNPYAYYDFLPSGASGYRESMKARFRVYDNCRYIQTNYNAFVRYLECNVGRLWTDVHRKMIDGCDRRSRERGTIDYLISRNVCFAVEMIDGKATSTSDNPRHSLSWFNYYVNPETGTLHRVNYVSYKSIMQQRNKAATEEQQKYFHKVDNLTEHHKIDGVWYEVKFTEYTPKITRTFVPWFTTRLGRELRREYVEYSYPLVFDVIKKQLVKEKRVATSRRTLSRKELKRYKLV